MAKWTREKTGGKIHHETDTYTQEKFIFEFEAVTATSNGDDNNSRIK